jgi:hypothetical protein
MYDVVIKALKHENKITPQLQHSSFITARLIGLFEVEDSSMTLVSGYRSTCSGTACRIACRISIGTDCKASWS